MSYQRLTDGTKQFFYGRTKAEVREKLGQADSAKRQGFIAHGPDQTVQQYLDRWLIDSVKPSVRPMTYESYNLNVRRLLPLIGRVRLRDLSPEHVQAAYGGLLRKGLAKRTVEQAHTVLHRALRQAVLWGLMLRNPTDAVSVPRPGRKELEVLTEEQIRMLFESTRDDDWHPLWVLLATTGLRIGEALGLTWKDVDLDSRRLVVNRALQWQRGRGLVLVEPKTRGSRRSAPLPHGTVYALRTHRAEQLKEQMRKANVWEKRDLVFCGATGAPVHATSLNTTLSRALRRAGLPRIRVHDLRHTAATHLLHRGVHPKVVQELLGHSTITLTLDTYSHVTSSLSAKAADEMEDLFQPSARAV